MHLVNIKRTLVIEKFRFIGCFDYVKGLTIRKKVHDSNAKLFDHGKKVFLRMHFYKN